MNCKELECELNFISLDFEDGESEECLVTGLYEIEGKKYLAVVVGADDDFDLEKSDELEGYIYEYAEAGEDEFELIDIESDDEFNRIAGIIEAFEEARDEE